MASLAIKRGAWPWGLEQRKVSARELAQTKIGLVATWRDWWLWLVAGGLAIENPHCTGVVKCPMTWVYKGHHLIVAMKKTIYRSWNLMVGWCSMGTFNDPCINLGKFLVTLHWNHGNCKGNHAHMSLFEVSELWWFTRIYDDKGRFVC